jgi:pimeloyl-ACP methyl ester carboxylesterase
MCDARNEDKQLETRCDSFLRSQTPFAATALVHVPVSLFQETASSNYKLLGGLEAASVSLFNPLAIDPNDGCYGIAQSPAMALFYARENSQYNPITAFVNGGNRVDRPELRFLEPYQADKIPLILVHGLISNPVTFLEMADAVRADPLLRRRYQIWVFRYPTGDEFLESAAILRQRLADAFACHCDGPRQLSLMNTHQRAVIVGHSMGGLLSKLQVTDSGDRLWRSVANVPLEQLRGQPKDIEDFRKLFYFSANPNIGRVVYIATPHQGSPWASRCIGRLASTLAGNRENEQQDYQDITRNNPGVFSGTFSDSLPSSVDLLRPSSRLLQALASTPSSPNVIVNSIIGDHYPLPRAGPSDGVVPVDSAFRIEAETTTIVNATHTSILRSNEAQQSLLGILRMHLSTPTTFSYNLHDSSIEQGKPLWTEVTTELSLEQAIQE